MTVYEQTRKAVQQINPAVKDVSKEQMLHIMTLVIDKYCTDHRMSCQQKCGFVSEILKNFIELRENV